MAVLSDPDRAETWAQFMRDNSASWGILTKSDIRAALNALDDFMSASAGAVNAAIPQPARGALTTPQKARLLQFVIDQRYIKGA